MDLHAGDQQYLQRAPVEARSTHAEVGIPELKHSPRARESSLMKRVGYRACAGRKHQRVVKDEWKQARAAVECRQHDSRDIHKRVGPPPQARLQRSVSALFNEAI